MSCNELVLIKTNDKPTSFLVAKWLSSTYTEQEFKWERGETSHYWTSSTSSPQPAQNLWVDDNMIHFLCTVQPATFLWHFETKSIFLKENVSQKHPHRGLVTCFLVKAKLFLVAARLANTWHAVNGLILQRNGGISRTEIWRLKVFPLKCSNFGSSSSCPPWCLSSETTSYGAGKRKEAQQ